MHTIFLLFALVITSNALTAVEYRNAFEDFKTEFGKTYTAVESSRRFAIFKDNLDFINNFDSKARGFTVKMNSFGDLNSKEFGSIFNGLNITKTQTHKRAILHATNVFGVSLDWRIKGAVTPVKNQGQCGSCWSFSATGSMEGANFIANGNLVSLSEQNLIDCSTSYGNQACNGGLMDNAFQYVIDNGGIDTEDSYPYTANGPNQCQYSSANVGATISSYQDVNQGDEQDLLAHLQTQPVSVAIDASQSSFQFYSGGVYYEPACSSTQLDHGVLAVGYGNDPSGGDYWIVKNSWGRGWGNGGYINMARNKNNNCGIASSASVPVV